jgi:DnaJ-class molecular chaperone
MTERIRYCPTCQGRQPAKETCDMCKGRGYILAEDEWWDEHGA